MQNEIWEQVGQFLNRIRSENISRNTVVEVPGYKDTQEELETLREKCKKIDISTSGGKTATAFVMDGKA